MMSISFPSLSLIRVRLLIGEAQSQHASGEECVAHVSADSAALVKQRMLRRMNGSFPMSLRAGMLLLSSYSFSIRQQQSTANYAAMQMHLFSATALSRGGRKSAECEQVNRACYRFALHPFLQNQSHVAQTMHTLIQHNEF